MIMSIALTVRRYKYIPESNKLAEMLVLIYKEFKKIKLRKEPLWKELLVKL